MQMNQTGPLPRTEVLLFAGFDDLDAIAPLEILTEAGFPVTIVRPPADPPRLRSSHGLSIDVDATLSEDPELVIVPGGGWLDGAPDGVRAQCAGELPALLAVLHRRGTVLASVCTGAMLLAAAGVLTGRPAVTNRQALGDLAAAGADVQRSARVVDAGDVVTSGGPAASLDLGIALVDRFAGPLAAADTEARIEHERVGPVLVSTPAA
jgi:putative intracellular protease/amidase